MTTENKQKNDAKTPNTQMAAAMTSALANAAGTEDKTSTAGLDLDILHDDADNGDDNPAQPLGDAAAVAAKPTRLIDCFGSYRFVPRLDSEVFTRLGRDGVTVTERTRKVCDVILELGNSGNVVSASITKVLKSGAKKAGLRMAFMWNDNTKKSAITPETDDARAQQAEFKEAIIGRFLAYCKANNIDLSKKHEAAVQHAVDADDLI